jgi:hypothetical protein
MTAVVELTVAGDAAAWSAVGLHVVDHVATVGPIRIRFVDGPPALTSWSLAGLPEPVTDIDGLATSPVAADPTSAPADAVSAPEIADAHPLGIVDFDHVVVMTSSLRRTCDAIAAATGEPLKRIREAGPIRQGFHRLGPMIVEVVENSQVSDDVAHFWGFVWNVADLDAAYRLLGADLLTQPKTAVQPGRQIATFRTAAGLGIPVALMTVPPPRNTHG